MENLISGVSNSVNSTRIHTDLKVEYPVFEVPSHGELSDHDDVATLRTSEFLEFALKEALQQSNNALASIPPERIGTVFGTTVGCAMNNEEFYRQYLRSMNPEMTAITRYLTNNPALYIREKFGYKGIAQTINNACASGTDAIGQAMSWINSGLCDAVIAGGTDELCRVVYNGFISLQVYSEYSPRPFSGNRDGLNLGEGAGVLILVRPDLAKEALGHILSYGTATDAYHPTAPHPEGDGLVKAIQEAFELSGTTPGDCAFINAHGTATPDNDKVEGQVFAKHLPRIPFFSPKAQTGHTLGAAGAIEAIITLELLNRQTIPQSIGYEELDPVINCSPVLKTTTTNKRIALSTSLAFGGTNSAIVIEGKNS